MTTQTTPDPEMTPGRAVAQWWAEQLGAPTFNSGDPMASLLATALNGNPGPLADEQVTTFVEHLASYVDISLGLRPDPGLTPHGLTPYSHMVLGTDYHPDRPLQDAAQAAGIPFTRFPWKTVTFAYPDHVAGSLGSGQRLSLLWNRAGWVRGACHAEHWANNTGDRWVRLPETCGLPRYHEQRDHGAWIPTVAGTTS